MDSKTRVKLLTFFEVGRGVDTEESGDGEEGSICENNGSLAVLSLFGEIEAAKRNWWNKDFLSYYQFGAVF